MFEVSMQFDDINISSIESEDLECIQNWLNLEKEFSKKNNLEFQDLYKRFLEYYASECEFFLKINKCNKLIGIVKGRIEFKNPNEVWFSFYLLDSNERGRGQGSRILNSIIRCFNERYGISKFFVAALANEVDMLKFFKKNKFELQRVSKNFYSMEGSYKDMLLLRRGE